MISTDVPSLVQAAQHNPVAFAALYDRYVGPVYRYIYSRVANVGDAEDLTAQTFLSALELLPGYRERGAFAGWLFAIAHSRLVDHFRREKPRQGLEAAMDLLAADDTAAAAEDRLDREKLALLLRGLPEDEQEIIRLRYVADLSFAEMAVTLGRREDAVKKTLYRLLARLQEQSRGQVEAS